MVGFPHIAAVLLSSCLANGARKTKGAQQKGAGQEDLLEEQGAENTREVYHFVAFNYGTGVLASQARSSFLKLKEECNREKGRTVIKRLSAGIQASQEGAAQGYTDGFMTVFPNAAMRDYYVGCLDQTCQEGGTEPRGGFCKAHDDFKFWVGSKLSTVGSQNHYNPGALVFDYKGVNSGDHRNQWTHSVFFRFKGGTSRSQKAQTKTKFLNLKSRCAGIVSIDAGAQNSKEPVHQRFDQGYFLVFNSKSALDNYVGCTNGACSSRAMRSNYCAAHNDFKQFVGPLLSTDAVPNTRSANVDSYHYHPGVFVFDFTSR